MVSPLPALDGRDIATVVLALVTLVPICFAAYGAVLLSRSRGDAKKRELAVQTVAGAIGAAVLAAVVYAVAVAIGK